MDILITQINNASSSIVCWKNERLKKRHFLLRGMAFCSINKWILNQSIIRHSINVMDDADAMVEE